MTKQKEARRVKIKYRVRNKISGTAGKTLVAASSLGQEACPKKEQAFKVGEVVAKKALEAGISEVVFDRNGYLYHGRVKEVAEGARKGGLKF